MLCASAGTCRESSPSNWPTVLIFFRCRRRHYQTARPGLPAPDGYYEWVMMMGNCDWKIGCNRFKTGFWLKPVSDSENRVNRLPRAPPKHPRIAGYFPAHKRALLRRATLSRRESAESNPPTCTTMRRPPISASLRPWRTNIRAGSRGVLSHKWWCENPLFVAENACLSCSSQPSARPSNHAARNLFVE